MCHEQRSRRVRDEAREEGRRIWDLFDRETRHEPEQPVAGPERQEEPDRAPADPVREPVETGR
jgi:hypothetical protein